LQDASKEFETTLNREARELEQATRKGTGSTSTSSRLNPRANQAAKTELAKAELAKTETEQAEPTSGDPEPSSETEEIPVSIPEESPAQKTVATSDQQDDQRDESRQEGSVSPDQLAPTEDTSSQANAA
ncbi:MAG: hypothetical protein HC924_02740, partial [Synechococcaceae cyanobacterium SM2_3_2]|nr:hypothetical protein [Synechococcaceae cyanobacterium SM2_3_2]